jgi:hypothetical protein
MGKNLKYVADFEFPSDCGFSGSSGKTMVKGYARGGAATPAPVKAAVHKHERAMHAGQPPTKLAKGGMAKRPPMPPTQAAAGMARKPAMPMQAKRRSVPVAPAGPMIGMKKGGSAKC